jgi:cytidine deaminase
MTTADAVTPLPDGSAPWDDLRAAASQVRRRAYARYSGYAVGAAAWSANGRLLTGCNVENASFGVTLCAECGVVSDLMAGGGGRLTAIACVGGAADGDGAVVLPCGRCRQLLAEHGGPDLLVDSAQGPVRLDALLPDAFAASDVIAGEAGRS